MTKTRGLRNLQQEIHRASRAREPLAVAYVDVDGLKALVSQGRISGDDLLRNVVEVLRSDLRRCDSIISLGGDAFLCVLPGVGMSGASSALRHLRKSIARKVGYDAINVGVAELEPHDTSETLVARADRDLVANRQLDASRAVAARDSWSQKREISR